ncbi:MAG TPA: lysozyme inhibitor LprI family protein [Bryobacteraceae bacterium]|nr:lysozyme inhibitor LprI family protein [Bryobacteraceae bacterium]
MRSIHLLLITLAFSRFAAAQSFDCNLAKSPREHAVCSHEKLAAFDSAVSTAYKSLRAHLSPESAALVQSDQREWLHWLDFICPAKGRGIASDINRCLLQEYTDRERDLQQSMTIGGMRLFLRSHFLYRAGNSNGELLAGNDPGFGYGALRWPEIDIPLAQPDPAWNAWNSAVKNRAAKLAVGVRPDEKKATFDTAVEDSGTIDGFYTVEAANEKFIDVSLIDMSYGWGAAHPLTNKSSFHWWLDRNRELASSDVFLPHSDWEDKHRFGRRQSPCPARL